ncbi:glycosyltransferase family 2 protein [Clostridium cylindrosporum]|uniref:Glycosyl transferase, group 2 n=1 Tax=Clostridium cylindrosporum DSM 605 TaxID=1121307 RepID=A0A0J8DEW7_CLOCY|nr:glycosyltransferase family 2 protein [Clostridium cylindrosporum]KMT22789.1 glycosyl transferase, group 2 [Clostridium cylindrosporum DSM 605]
MEFSLCMIVKDEEKVLSKCLESVKDFIDEIILVDTGSSDLTKEIGAKFGATIYDFKWCDDFSKARNYAFSKSTKDYILWLDADGYITQDNIDKLVNLKKTLNPNVDVVSMHYSLVRDENENTIYSLRRNRLVKRERNFKWVGRIHEYIDVYGRSLHSDIYIYIITSIKHIRKETLIYLD